MQSEAPGRWLPASGWPKGCHQQLATPQSSVVQNLTEGNVAHRNCTQATQQGSLGALSRQYVRLLIIVCISS